MKKKYVLELTFENEEGKRRKIEIDNPKLGLTEEEIIPAMQKILDADIFGYGTDKFADAISARYVETTVNEVYDGSKN